MLIWSIFLTGVVALFFFIMYPRTDYIQTVETPIAQTAIVQFTEQHKGALNLALKAVESTANRTDSTYTGAGSNTNNLTIYYPDFASLEKTNYLPKGLDQLDWDTKPQSRIVCIDYDSNATARLSTANACSIGGYTSMTQSTIAGGTRDYLITYAPKPTDLDSFFPGWGAAWNDETRGMDTCGIVKDGKIQSPKCPGGLCDLSASANTTRLQNLINASGLTLENNGFICISPIDHYAYDGISITGKNKNMLAYYDGINNTWTGHSNTTTTWYDLSGNGNNATIMDGTVNPTNVYLNGSVDQKIQLPNFLKNNQNLDADIVFNPTRINPSWNMLFSGSGDNNDFQIFFEQGSKKMRLSIENKELESSFQLTDETINLPYSFFATYRRINSVFTGNLYVNAQNKLQNRSFGINQYELSTSPLYLGGLNSTLHNFPIQGKYYAARFYTQSLTKAQIALNYQLDRKRFNMPKVVDNNGNDYTYLQNDGVAFIKTGFIPKGGSKAYIKAKIMKTTGNQDYGGVAARDLGVNSYFAPFMTANTTFGFYFNSYHLTGKTVSVGNIVESTLTVNMANTSADVKYNNLTNGTSYTTTQTGSISTSNDIYLFAGHGSNAETGGENATAQIARYTIWQDDVLQHDFIPAEDPFGRPAMYDKAGGKFYYNVSPNTTSKFTLVNN